MLDATLSRAVGGSAHVHGNCGRYDCRNDEAADWQPFRSDVKSGRAELAYGRVIFAVAAGYVPTPTKFVSIFFRAVEEPSGIDLLCWRECQQWNSDDYDMCGNPCMCYKEHWNSPGGPMFCDCCQHGIDPAHRIKPITGKEASERIGQEATHSATEGGGSESGTPRKGTKGSDGAAEGRKAPTAGGQALPHAVERSEPTVHSECVPLNEDLTRVILDGEDGEAVPSSGDCGSPPHGGRPPDDTSQGGYEDCDWRCLCDRCFSATAQLALRPLSERLQETRTLDEPAVKFLEDSDVSKKLPGRRLVQKGRGNREQSSLLLGIRKPCHAGLQSTWLSLCSCLKCTDACAIGRRNHLTKLGASHTCVLYRSAVFLLS